MDSLLEGYQIIDKEWRYRYVNNAAAAHGRRPKEELLGRTMMEVYPGIEKTGMYATLRHCMEKRIHARLENEFEFPDGSRAWFDLSVGPLPEGIFILSIDISERKKAAELLRKSVARLQLQFEHMPTGCIVWNQQFRVTAWNPAATDIFGYSSSEAIGKHPYELIVPTSAQARVDAVWQRLLEGDTTAHSTNENVTKSGRIST